MESFREKFTRTSPPSSRLGRVYPKSGLSFRDIQNKGDLTSFKNDLIYGYIREEYEKKHNTQIPVEIIRLIIFYFQEWHLSSHRLRNVGIRMAIDSVCRNSMEV